MSGSIERYSHLSITRSTPDGVTHTEVHVTQISSDVSECFDPAACCDVGEQALIAALRAYLRPVQAPECLLAKLQATLDECCREEEQR